MEGSGSSGFDMSKMSTAEKLLAGGSILLLIDSFFPWQRVCASDVLGDLGDLAGFDACASFTMWGGSGSFFGFVAGLLAIALIVFGVLSMTGSMANNMGSMSADKLTGFLGLGVAAFGLLKFIFALTESPGWAAFVGLVLLVAIGWGAWQKVQSSGGFQMGDTGGGTMGGTMGGGTPPPSAPPPSAPPPSMPPTEPPPSGGMPPSGTSDM
ncbi:MAG TPA: hypothetical protein VFI35_01125 [Actinomycetota bacterium]|nr:hypothetical protein [Actinomycetota bacterium]